MPFNTQPAAGYKFNNFQEIKSHSSILFNERVAILMYILDTNSISLNTNYSVDGVRHVHAILLQIYKNIRTLIRNNPTMRSTLDLETKDKGIYITDVALGTMDRMMQYCETYGYTYRKLYIMIQELNNFEMIMKDILQYYHYFIRPDFRQKPDVQIATEKYKEIADSRTIDELRSLVGKNHDVDFESLGSSRIELQSDYQENGEDNQDSEEPLIPIDEEGGNEDDDEETIMGKDGVNDAASE